MKKEVKTIIHHTYPIAEQSLQKIVGMLRLEAFEKGATFIKRGKPNNREYFLLRGICKSYVLSPEGEEITISLFADGSILSPYQIRTSGTVSNLNFKALTTVELASIDAKAFENLMIEHLDIRTFANRVLQNELIAKVEKEIGLAALTARERLIAFREKHGDLENRIPHPDIASYLGITNISLSRLRKNLMGP